MSNANYVNYQVALTPENAPLIDQMNQLVLGAGDASKKSAPTATEAGTTTKSKSSDTASVTLDDVKSAAKAAKKDHGEDFAMQVLKDAKVDVNATLGHSMGKIDASQYDAIIAAWKAGPQLTEEASDIPDDDGFGDDDDGFGDDTPTVSVDAVKDTLKAYAKSESREAAKKIMNDNGAKALSDVDKCDQDQLAAMLKAMV